MPERERVVSVSLGASSGDMAVETEFLGVPFRIEREGTDGDVARAARRLRELDGAVSALGLGGTDLYLFAGDRRYVVREAARMTAGVVRTPVVDGSGLKNTLEREVIRRLSASGAVPVAGTEALMTAAVDRFGMAEALVECGAKVTFGDLVFGLGLPIPIRSLAALRRLARLLLPMLCRLPISWLYPTGAQQEERRPRASALFRRAEIVAGDGHLIARFIPDGLNGPVIITNTVRARHRELFRRVGARALVPTTPVFDGQSFGTNVLEGVFVTLLRRRGRAPSPEAYLELLDELGWQPLVIDLTAP